MKNGQDQGEIQICIGLITGIMDMASLKPCELDEIVFKPLWGVLMKGVAVTLGGGLQPQSCGRGGLHATHSTAHTRAGQLPRKCHGCPMSGTAGRALRGLPLLETEPSPCPKYADNPSVLVTESSQDQGSGPDPPLRVELVQGLNSKSRRPAKGRNTGQDPGEGRQRMRELHQCCQ